MALDDLDLEFEDEEEAKKKKNEAVQQDVDLEFHAQDNDVKPRPTRPGPPPSQQPTSVGSRPQPVQPMAQVKKLDDARNVPPVKRPVTTASASPSPVSVGANAMKVQSQPLMEDQYDLESEEIVQLRERARKAEFDADVKVQVAEFKTELLSELLGDMKLMDHQINQLLVRINAKHPDMKQEVLMIKKILADFTSKKRK
jgi:hypothetical protein